MNTKVAEWCARLKKATRILYLPDGPFQMRECLPERYDVIITQGTLDRLDDKEWMSCLWRLGYEFAAPGCVLVLELEEWPEGLETYSKLSSVGWCRWDSDGPVSMLRWVQELAPWLPTEHIQMMSPSIVMAGGE